jgi:uncharacterized protein (TIGR02391 family)
MIEVNNRVKRHLRAVGDTERDGADLMRRAFTPNSPVIRLAELDTDTGKSEQEGYMQIFAGAMMAIRNPKAHSHEVIDEKRAIHHLFLASLLMFKIDEAGVP